MKYGLRLKAKYFLFAGLIACFLFLLFPVTHYIYEAYETSPNPVVDTLLLTLMAITTVIFFWRAHRLALIARIEESIPGIYEVVSPVGKVAVCGKEYIWVFVVRYKETGRLKFEKENFQCMRKVGLPFCMVLPKDPGDSRFIRVYRDGDISLEICSYPIESESFLFDDGEVCRAGEKRPGLRP